MNNKYISFAIATVFVLMPVLSMAAPSVGSGDSSANFTAPTSGGSDSSANPGVPSSGGSASSANPGTPSVGSTDSSAGISNDSTDNSLNNTSSSGGSSSGGGSIYGGGGSAVTIGISVNSLNNCLGINQYMRKGMNNDANQVRILQSFLKNTQEVDVDVNGIFDDKTENAVKIFQTRYANIILAPWNTAVPSGIVSITTLKKINQLACNHPLTLSVSELAKINSYKSGSTWKEAPQNPPTVVVIESDESLDGVGIQEIDNTASVSNTPLSTKFWNFLKSLF